MSNRAHGFFFYSFLSDTPRLPDFPEFPENLEYPEHPEIPGNPEYPEKKPNIPEKATKSLSPSLLLFYHPLQPLHLPL